MDLHEEIGQLTARLLHRVKRQPYYEWVWPGRCAANADRGGGAIGLVR